MIRGANLGIAFLLELAVLFAVGYGGLRLSVGLPRPMWRSGSPGSASGPWPSGSPVAPSPRSFWLESSPPAY